MSKVSHFFAYVSRLRWIRRWSLMRNAIVEDVATHSWEVAKIAHALAVIRNTHIQERGLEKELVDANKLAVAGIYHDATEVITGDMPTPVKYHSNAMRDAYKNVEHEAEKELLELMPASMQATFSQILFEDNLTELERELLKSADRLSALLKCRAELRAGNREFEHAAGEIEKRLLQTNLHEVTYFLEVFAPAYDMTLDNLLRQ